MATSVIVALISLLGVILTAIIGLVRKKAKLEIEKLKKEIGGLITIANFEQIKMYDPRLVELIFKINKEYSSVTKDEEDFHQSQFNPEIEIRKSAPFVPVSGVELCISGPLLSVTSNFSS